MASPQIPEESALEVREPVTLEESFVAALEAQFNCTQSGEAVMPPPSDCPAAVHAMYGLAKYHVLTILIVVVFTVVLFQMIMIAMNPRGGGH